MRSTLVPTTARLVLALLTGLAIVAAPASSARAQTTSLGPGEAVTFFPTEAALDVRRQVWVVPVHAVVYNAALDAASRHALLQALAGALDLPADSPRSATFAQRAQMFMVDVERDQGLVVSLAGQRIKLAPSEADGHVHGTAEVPAAAADLARPAANPDWLTIAVVLPGNDSRHFEGRIRLLPPTGLSVVVDLDDTLLLTESADQGRMLRRSFLQPLEAVPGMAALCSRAAAEGATFHYLSSQPWPLHEPLAAFIASAGLPDGPLSLSDFRGQDEKVAHWFARSQDHKLAALVALAGQSPERRLILMGDSSAHDPELFGEIARRCAEHVEHVLIREVNGRTRDDPRYVAAFRDVPPETWTLFAKADELTTLRAPPVVAKPRAVEPLTFPKPLLR